MTSIRFKTATLEETECVALEAYGRWVNTFEHDADAALEQLSVFVEAQEGLSAIVGSLESIQSDTDLQQLRSKVNTVMAPMGLDFDGLQPANESGSKFSIEGFKEMLRRLWRAIKRTIAAIWSFLHKGFARTFAQHRRVAASISNIRISMNNLRTALPSSADVPISRVDLLTKGADEATYVDIARAVNQFMNVRHALLDRYSVKLAVTIKSVLASRGPIRMDDTNRLETIRVGTNKVLQNFDRQAVAAVFPGAANIDDQNTVVPLVGPYFIQITGRKLPPINDATFGRAARSLSIDIGRSAGDDEKSSSTNMKVMTFSQVNELLRAAEAIINDLGRGHTAERSKRIEALVQSFDQWVATSAKLAEDWVTQNDNQATAREESLRFFREQASFSSAMTAWGGPVFLKMDTLALRVAAGIVSLCQAHLKVYS